jgi:hypothetical protein
MALACAWLAVLVPVPAAAQADVVAEASVGLPTSATVGSTGVPASITLRNGNTGFEEILTNSVCNAGDLGPLCATPAQGIVLVPSCTHVAASRCTAAGADPGVLAVSPTAVGRSGTACAGMSFTTAVVDPVFGTVRFTPAAGASVLLPQGAACRIDFTFNVLRAPAVDVKPATQNVDTVALTTSTQYSDSSDPSDPSEPPDPSDLFDPLDPLDPLDPPDPLDLSGLSSGAAGVANIAIARSKPSLATTAPETATLGEPVSASAMLNGGRSPSAGPTMSFRLYGPSDGDCTQAPVFQSLGLPYPVAGGWVSSAAFTPARAGTYRWVASYSGDRYSNPVTGSCNAAAVSVRAGLSASSTRPTCAGRTATIVARPGARTVRGTRGNDVIVGGGAGERIYGGAGNDTICGGRGADTLRGGPGKDTLLGEEGKDRLYGDAGADRIRAAGGGADRIDCGAGRGDSVQLDRRDRQKHCERIRRVKR